MKYLLQIMSCVCVTFLYSTEMDSVSVPYNSKFPPVTQIDYDCIPLVYFKGDKRYLLQDDIPDEIKTHMIVRPFHSNNGPISLLLTKYFASLTFVEDEGKVLSEKLMADALGILETPNTSQEDHAAAIHKLWIAAWNIGNPKAKQKIIELFSDTYPKFTYVLNYFPKTEEEMLKKIKSCRMAIEVGQDLDLKAQQRRILAGRQAFESTIVAKQPKTTDEEPLLPKQTDTGSFSSIFGWFSGNTSPKVKAQ